MVGAGRTYIIYHGGYIKYHGRYIIYHGGWTYRRELSLLKRHQFWKTGEHRFPKSSVFSKRPLERRVSFHRRSSRVIIAICDYCNSLNIRRSNSLSLLFLDEKFSHTRRWVRSYIKIGFAISIRFVETGDTVGGNQIKGLWCLFSGG